MIMIVIEIGIVIRTIIMEILTATVIIVIVIIIIIMSMMEILMIKTSSFFAVLLLESPRVHESVATVENKVENKGT